MIFATYGGIENKRVQFIGMNNDSKILAKYNKEAITSISFGQAGLAVSQSLGNGVPLITKSNGISGDEKSHLSNFFNSDSYHVCLDYLIVTLFRVR